MNASASDNNNPESALSTSDLKGLLKAASLAEFRPDESDRTATETFEKSNSLFDLVRSGLSDGDASNEAVEPKGSTDAEKAKEDSVELSADQIGEHQDKQSNEDIITTGILPITNNEESGSANSEAGPEAKNVVKLKPGEQSLKELSDTEDPMNVQDTFEQVTLADDADESPIEALSIVESDEFQEKIQNLQLEFDRKLTDEKQIFTKTLEVLFGASDFILAEMESQISDFVLTVASDLAGSKIDKLPTPFAKKIMRVAKQIVGNENEVIIHLNTEDFKVVNSVNIGSDIKCKFLEKSVLKRAEFEVLGRKSAAAITLFDPTKGN